MPFSLHPLLQTSPSRDYFIQDNACRITYSRLGEDVIIHHLLTSVLKKTKPGFYVDIGAFHPRASSNTKFLAILGWKGINIDANENSIDAFRKERPHDINVCCGVAEKEGVLTYHKFAGIDAANTFSPAMAKQWQEENGWVLKETSTRPVRPINAILDEHLPKNQTIDYMNIDIEGLDEVVIQSLDLSRYRPSILSIELHNIDILAASESPAIQYMIRHGYSLVSVNVATYIFLENQDTSQTTTPA